MHLHLAQPRQPVLHRVLDGNQIGLGVVSLVDGGVERGRLARARGAGHEDCAVWEGERLEKQAEVVLEEAEVFERHHDRVAAQQPQDRHLAGDDREHRDSEVDRLAVQHHAEAPVLGDSPLGDIHPRRDLEAAEQLAVHLSGQRVNDLAHAVNPIADAQIVVAWFDVDVAGTCPDGVGDDLVHESSDDRLLAFLVLVLISPAHLLLEVADHVADVGLRSREARDGAEQIALRGDDGPDLLARDDAHVVDREDVGGVDHG